MDDIIFTKLKELTVKRKYLLSISFFRLKISYREFGIYERYMGKLIKLQNTKFFENYNLRIYVDSSTKDNKILDLTNAYKSIEIIQFEAKKFKIDEYHNGTFGTLIRLYPLFNNDIDSYELIRISDIDLICPNYFSMKEENILIKNNLDFMFLRCVPYKKIWTNPDMPHTMMAGFILSKINFPKEIFDTYIQELYKYVIKQPSILEEKLDKIMAKTNIKYGNKNIYLPYGVDELLLNYYLYPHIQKKKIKYGVRVEFYPNIMFRYLNKYDLSDKERSIVNKLELMEYEIYCISNKKINEYLKISFSFFQKFKNKINDYYDELLEEILKYKDNFKNLYFYYLVPK